jgi:MFS family permease
MGLLFAGLAIGPTIGSVLIHYTQQPLSVFSLAAALHLSFIVIVLGVLPEPLSRARMEASTARWKTEATIGTSARILKTMSSLFSPLKLFLPRPLKKGNNIKRHGKDWNMTLLALASACLGTFMAGHFRFGLVLQSMTSLAGVISLQIPVRDSCFWVDARDSAWVVLLLNESCRPARYSLVIS